MDEDNIITLNDENGNEVEFEFLDLIPYRRTNMLSCFLLEIRMGKLLFCS